MSETLQDITAVGQYWIYSGDDGAGGVFAPVLKDCWEVDEGGLRIVHG